MLGANSPIDFQILVDAFWAGTTEINAELAGLVREHDLAGLKLAAHSAKGAALYIGAVALSDALAKLEKLAAKLDLEKCDKQVSRVTKEFSRVEEYLESRDLSE